MRPILIWLLLGVMLFLGWHSCQPRRTAPGVLIGAEPVQTAVPPGSPPLQIQGFTLHALATYEISARVLHKKRYFDESCDLAPYDLAVGWGPMSDQRVLDQLEISQGNRFFFWRYEHQPPLPIPEIIAHGANMHLIPANQCLFWKIFWLHAGDLVRLRGMLVEADRPGFSPWRSSLSRTDSGNGACELMFVQQIDRLPLPAAP